MKIAVYHNMPSGGAKRHTLEQVRELARRGHELVEYAPSTADLGYSSFAPYVSRQVIYPFTGWEGGYHLPLISPYLNTLAGFKLLESLKDLNQRAAQEIDAGGFDLVLAKDCQFTYNPYVLRYLKTPSLFQCHHGLRNRLQSFNPPPSTFREKAARLVYSPARIAFDRRLAADEAQNIRSATRVITNSKHIVNQINKYYRLEAYEIYPGINPDLFRPMGLKKENFILSVGSLTFNKGYRFMIAALGQLPPDRRPPLRIAANVVDPPEQTTLEALAAQLGVDLQIDVIRDDQRLVEMYNQALLMVYTPLEEALGLAPLEAMACGTPVLAVAEAGVKETIPDGLAGYLVNRDEAVFAAKLDELLHDPAELARLSANAVPYIHQNWTWSRAVDNLEAHMRAAISATRKI